MNRTVTLHEELQRALGAERVRDSGAELSLYRRDAGHMTGVASVVCFPTTTAEVAACVRVAADAGVPFVARGSGTGLAGGAVPPDGAVVISLTKMNQIRAVDPASRRAWVEPGVLNLDLSRAVAVHGLHFAPDPSSQQTCTIGGNVANNSGGPHCLAEGVTASHILALEVVLPDGDRHGARWRGPGTSGVRPARRRSLAVRGCAASPRRSVSVSPRTRPWCGRCCSTSTTSRPGPRQ